MLLKTSINQFNDIKEKIKINNDWIITNNLIIFLPKGIVFILDKRVKRKGFLEVK